MITNNANDVLYTPIDSTPVPNYDITKLLNWVKEHSPSQNVDGRLDASKNEYVSKNYPWNIVYPKVKGEWRFDFNSEFPEIANFCSEAFQLQEDDIHHVTLLPIKNEFAGTGFWHRDPDRHGLRIYLENTEPGEFLLIKPTIDPYNERVKYGDGNFASSVSSVPLQDTVHSAKLKSSRQVFYINNVRAVHAVQVSQPGRLRIAVILGATNSPEINNKLHNLICRSAEKFSDYSLYWSAP
jgi:hypothetical protein